MAFNLPKAWSPGMALPQYVRDEGLERHAFTSLEDPDGTYDNPDVGTGGYVVPQYVIDEGYGQGAYVTKWAPRGTYYGRKIPNWLNRPGNKIKATSPGKNGGTTFTLQSLPDPNRVPGITRLGGGSNYSATPTAAAATATAASAAPSPAVIHPAYEQYGHRAASVILSGVSKLPPAQRKPVLKRTLDTIDKSLWTRTQTIANGYVRGGMHPTQALHHGLARAMSTGLLAEVIKTGKSGKKPAPVGQLGLGCYGANAVMNGKRSSMGSLGNATVPKLSLTSILTSVATPAAAPPVNAPGITAQLGPFSFSQDQVTWLFANPTKAMTLPIAQDSATHSDPTELSSSAAGPAWAAWFQTISQTPPGNVPGAPAEEMGNYWYNAAWSTQPVTQASYQAWMTALGATPDQNYYLAYLSIWGQGTIDSDWPGWYNHSPVATFQNPANGQMFGVWFELVKRGTTYTRMTNAPGTGSWYDVTNDTMIPVMTGGPVSAPSTSSWYPWDVGQPTPDQPVIRGGYNQPFDMRMIVTSVDYATSLQPQNASLFLALGKDALDFLGYIAKIIWNDIVMPIISAVGGLACDLLGNPVGQVGAVAAGAAVGGVAGAKAGSVGAGIGAAACGTPVVQPATADTWLLPVAIAGGIGLLMIMVGMRPKRTRAATAAVATTAKKPVTHVTRRTTRPTTRRTTTR